MDFRIGPWLAKPDTNCLVSGCRECHVTPKSMDLLVCLARRQGGVTSKTEIFEEVWAGSFVSDDALVRCIGELRRTLGDNARTPAIIETIAKRGYRIVAPVVWDETPAGAADRASPEVPAIPAPPAGPARRWRSQWVGAGAAVVLAAAAAAFGWTRSCATHANSAASIRSIAVLPLRNASSDPEQEHFADGMTDALITRIAQIEALRVTSYTSVLRYKGTTASLKEVARALQVDGLIEGSVLRSGSRVRITTQLIRADSDTHLWSAAFEREMADVLSLQAEIARVG